MDKVIAKLHNDHIGIFGTVSPDGVPQTAAIHVALDEENFVIVIGTHNNSRKYQNILNNPKSSLVVGFDESTMETVQMDGTAYVPEGEELERLIDIYYTKFPNARIFKDDPKSVHIAFKPTWIRYSHFKAKPPIIEEITPNK